MRVLYVQQHFATDRGEAGVRGWRLVQALRARGHEVTVVCGENWRDPSLRPARAVDERDVDGVRVVQVAVFYSNHQGLAARVGSFLRFAALATREVLRRPADLVYASSTPLTVSVPALAKRLLQGTPYVFEVRDLWPDLAVAMGALESPLLVRALEAWERLAYRGAWRLVALAPGIKQGIVRRGGVDPATVAVVPNGSDTGGIPARPRAGPRRHLDVPEGTLLLGYCGTHGPANGLDQLLDAAAVLRRRGVGDVAFALVGDGREKARLVERARREGLEAVRFLPLVAKDRYADLLADLDVGVQVLRDVPAFRWGTSPNKFFDYLAAGRPVLVTYPGWMAALVTAHGCGLAAGPGPEALADAILALRDRRAELPAMGARARALADERFAMGPLLARLVEFLEAAEPGPPPDVVVVPVPS